MGCHYSKAIGGKLPNSASAVSPSVLSAYRGAISTEELQHQGNWGKSLGSLGRAVALSHWRLRSKDRRLWTATTGQWLSVKQLLAVSRRIPQPTMHRQALPAAVCQPMKLSTPNPSVPRALAHTTSHLIQRRGRRDCGNNNDGPMGSPCVAPGHRYTIIALQNSTECCLEFTATAVVECFMVSSSLPGLRSSAGRTSTCETGLSRRRGAFRIEGGGSGEWRYLDLLQLIGNLLSLSPANAPVAPMPPKEVHSGPGLDGYAEQLSVVWFAVLSQSGNLNFPLLFGIGICGFFSQYRSE